MLFQALMIFIIFVSGSAIVGIIVLTTYLSNILKQDMRITLFEYMKIVGSVSILKETLITWLYKNRPDFMVLVDMFMLYLYIAVSIIMILMGANILF